jgi:hippurate hydrolase
MHACGHDVHMTSWLGTAKVLVALKSQWRGRLMFIAQPAEEGLRGAKAMLADGLLTRFPRPDFGFALHVNPSAAGSVTIKPGTNTSASDSLEIVFKGRGGHGSMPSATIDPIVIAARFVTDVQSIISREKDAGQFGVITVGSFQAGTVANIIPDTALLKLTLRSFSPQVRKLLLDGVQRTATASALLANAPAPEVRIVSGTGAVVSDEALANRTAEVFERAFGNAFTFQPSNAEPGSASEDFSEFIAAGIPSVLFGVGVSDPAAVAAAQAGGPPVPVNHSPYFAPVPEPSIKTAVRAMSLAVLEALRQ